MKFFEKFVRGTKFMQAGPSPWSFRNKGYEIFLFLFQNKTTGAKLSRLDRAIYDSDISKGYDISLSR